MPKGRTGAEIIKSWFTKQTTIPTEKQFFNPLDAKIGAHARLNNVMATIRGEKDVDLSGDLFTVAEIWVWDRSKHGDKLPPFADYHLESGDKKLVIRVFPTVTRGKAGEPELLLLTQHWPESDEPYPWGEDSPFILDGCMDAKGQLTRHLGTENEEVYYRDLCNVTCRVSRIRDANQDGIVEMDEVQKLDYSLWTFRRDTKDDHGQDFTQHLHVQLSGIFKGNESIIGGDKTILMLAGESIAPSSLMMY